MCFNKVILCSKKHDAKKVTELFEIGNLPKLYHWPFSNVSSKNGSVCYGNNNIRKIEKLSDLDILPIIFFDSALNGDYYYSGRTTLKKETIRELLDTLMVKKNFRMKSLLKSTYLIQKEKNYFNVRKEY